MKFFVIAALALIMSIPGLMISSMVDDRNDSHGLAAHWENNQRIEAKPTTVLGIRLVDSYRSTNRSLKYITLFLGLVFLTYFIFEITTSKRIHPAQYALVGVAQVIFYLLLLSLSEHIGFDLAFMIAGSATIALFSMYVHWIFGGAQYASRAAAIFTTLYLFIYALLRLGDYALLIGSVTSFAAVAATMYFTRHLDWYSMGFQEAQTSPASAPRESWLD
ncbi:inner membrane CreD family protein [Granulicella cerasi]|uniref:Inner membrane CreD family protein n=2 Tax=Granulicella cerasi TaxID=741063 RepID=A0ABW1ZBK9_9BACT